MRTRFQMPADRRRKRSRVQTAGVQVYWSCSGKSDVLPVRDLSLGGIFVETRQPTPVGVDAHVDFLVEEGQIRTHAVVRHVQQARGMGLEFTAIAQADRPRLAALLNRLRSSPRAGASQRLDRNTGST